MTRQLSFSVLFGLFFPLLAEAQDSAKKAIQDVLKEALQAAEQIPEPYDQSRALGRIAKTQAMAGFKEQAKKTFAKAFRVAETIGKDDPKKTGTRIKMQFFIAEMMADAGDIPGAIAAVDKLMVLGFLFSQRCADYMQVLENSTRPWQLRRVLLRASICL